MMHARTETVFEDLKRSLLAGRLAHAYVLVGEPDGEGRALALRLLQLLFCVAPDKPCGHCAECLRVARKLHPDVLWVEPAKKSRIISVAQIRELEHRALETAFAGGWKVGVLLYADRLRPEAANAFLKTLEEPPGRSLFLLLTESPQSLLPTILSRCHRVVLGGAAPAASEEVRKLLAEMADVARLPGTLSRLACAQQLQDLLGTRKKAIEREVAELDDDADVDKDVQAARVEARYKAERVAIVRAVLLWHRDVMIAAAGAGEELLHYPEFAARIRQAGARLSWQQATSNVQSIEEMQRLLETNVPEPLVLEHSLMRLSV